MTASVVKEVSFLLSRALDSQLISLVHLCSAIQLALQKTELPLLAPRTILSATPTVHDHKFNIEKQMNYHPAPLFPL